MKRTIDVTDARRKKQIKYNEEHGIEPKTIKKAIKDGIEAYRQAKEIVQDVTGETEEEYDILEVLAQLEGEMEEAARNLQFEKAIVYRDQIHRLKKVLNNDEKESVHQQAKYKKKTGKK
jgi:excinuclease ABC subunit B